MYSEFFRDELVCLSPSASRLRVLGSDPGVGNKAFISVYQPSVYRTKKHIFVASVNDTDTSSFSINSEFFIRLPDHIVEQFSAIRDNSWQPYVDKDFPNKRKNNCLNFHIFPATASSSYFLFSSLSQQSSTGISFLSYLFEHNVPTKTNNELSYRILFPDTNLFSPNQRYANSTVKDEHNIDFVLSLIILLNKASIHDGLKPAYVLVPFSHNRTTPPIYYIIVNPKANGWRIPLHKDPGFPEPNSYSPKEMRLNLINKNKNEYDSFLSDSFLFSHTALDYCGPNSAIDIALRWLNEDGNSFGVPDRPAPMRGLFGLHPVRYGV